jgi:hypothetical protein
MTRTAHLFSLYTLINRHDLMPKVIRFRNDDLAEVLYKCRVATAFDSNSKRPTFDLLAS